MNKTFGAPALACGARYGSQSGFESRMSTSILPLNDRSAMVLLACVARAETAPDATLRLERKPRRCVDGDYTPMCETNTGHGAIFTTLIVTVPRAKRSMPRAA